MQSFIDIHTHHRISKNAIVNFYAEFDKHDTVPQSSLGLHPWYLQNADEYFFQLAKFAPAKNVLTIGECGLDKVCDTDWQLQERVFKKQIELANQLQKPLIIHCVRAYNECISFLKQSEVPVIFHGFNSNINIANMLLEKGFYLSIGTVIFNQTFENVFERLPLERIFFETDDSQTEISHIYKRASEIKNISIETLILQIENNFQKIFTNAR